VTTIGNLLNIYREHHRLTQQELAQQLSEYSSDFKNLNSVTISRWETGTTTPGCSKKQRILHFLISTNCLHKIEACSEIVKQAYVKLFEPLSKLFNRNYQYLIGNFPEFKVDWSNIHTLSNFPGKNEHYEHIVDIERATNIDGYYTLTKERLMALCEHPSSFAVICERKRQHLGHFVMFKIKNRVAEEIVHHNHKEYAVTLEDLCTPNEKGTYYIHALYGKNPSIAALLNVHAYLYLFEHLEFTDNVLIFSSRKDGPLLTKHYGIELIKKGYNDFFGFEWHGFMSPVENILFSDTVVKRVF
jgi:transcriptional regulator with XRE-family HTH domain